MVGKGEGGAREFGLFDQATGPAVVCCQWAACRQEANWAYRLLGDRMAFEQARAATQGLLRRLATPEGIRKAKERRVVAARAVVT